MALPLTHFAAPVGEKPLLRISTAGSVDDGKSTLIGRLLLDSKQVWEDHLDEIGRSNVNRASRGPDLSLLTDGLRAEREQGITIDVAYRYFSTPRRKFIVADTPGHEQYTRNMATGASTAEVAIILIDARKGVLAQSHRHAFIAWLLGVRRLIFAINKMDLVDFSRDVFDNIRTQAAPLLAHLSGAHADFLPVSALDGDNVVESSSRTPWYDGPSLLDLIETLHPPPPASDFRFPVQLVIRPHLDFRGYAGQIASGTVRPGDEIVALPSGRTTRVKRIVTFDGNLDEAVAPLSVTLELEDELDIARGDIIAHAATPLILARRIVACVVWMNEHPLSAGATGSSSRGPHRAGPRHPDHPPPGCRKPRPECGGSLQLNDIGQVEIETAEPLVFDSYRDNARPRLHPRRSHHHLTMAAGLIENAARATERRKSKLAFESAAITPAERASLFGHHGTRVDLSARPTLAPLTERTLLEQGCRVFLRHTPEVPIEPLRDAGLIVLDTQPGPDAVTGAAGLSHDDDEAVLELIERLRRASVFSIMTPSSPAKESSHARHPHVRPIHHCQRTLVGRAGLRYVQLPVRGRRPGSSPDRPATLDRCPLSRHRVPFPRGLRIPEPDRCPVRDHCSQFNASPVRLRTGIAVRHPQSNRPFTLLPSAQSRTAHGRPRPLQALVHRTPPRAVADPRQSSAGRIAQLPQRSLAHQAQPPVRLVDARRRSLSRSHDIPRLSLYDDGLHQHRLRPMHG